MNHNYYLDLAEESAKLSSCVRRKFGAVIVKNDRLISIGNNDVPNGLKSCSEIGYCIRSKYNIDRGTRYELCRSVHAEANAIMRSSHRNTNGSILYLVGLEEDNTYTKNAEPCIMCKRLIINAGIHTVICRINKDNYRVINVNDWVVNDQSMNLIDSYTKGDTKWSS